MLLELIRNSKFLQIQMLKVLGTEHGGIYHLKGVRFSKELVRGLHSLV